MSDLPSVKQKVQTESTRYRSAVSEFLVQTIGKSVNWLIDKADSLDADISGLFLGQAVSSAGNVVAGGPFVLTCPAGQYFSGTLVMVETIGTSPAISVSSSGYVSVFGPLDPAALSGMTNLTPSNVEMYRRETVIMQIRLEPSQSITLTALGAGTSARFNLSGHFLDSKSW